MKQFAIKARETVIRTYIIEAESAEQALAIFTDGTIMDVIDEEEFVDCEVIGDPKEFKE